MIRISTIFTILLLLCPDAYASELKVATWNLGWHLSKAEATTWIAKCSAPFQFNSATRLWEPAESGTPGWELPWGRNAPIAWNISVLPPCDVFKTPGFDTVSVTEAAYVKRSGQLTTFIESKIAPDVIAFQEVSAEQAVRDVLPNDGADYLVCSFGSHKVQRLAFAWKKEFGAAVECEVEDALSLSSSLAEKDRVRPGLALALTIDGKLTRFLDVHLKSGCVSPLDNPPDALEGNAGDDNPCIILQQQVVPLEKWIERKSSDTNRVVVLGDFNRNVWHETHEPGKTRTDGSDPKSELPSTVKVRKLIDEVNDGAPEGSKLTLLDEACPINTASDEACKRLKSAKMSDDEKLLKRSENLGCRNPVGLDHIMIGAGFSSPHPAEKVALGRQGRTLSASAEHPNPLLSLSDHCPLTAVVSD
ncbi:endonuclease/exonuclease/phosphatase family protein [Rhizobium laguerreae]|uniref:endonuclease/exonuclease/phosphatase family protein n=1 Tax=Rhizobium laguerreae TaxID=1076926 RepID=UPI00104016FB|nr:endonuclease/exonuclease/phosphatase family protein [Rhizobium laguerreae]TBX74462.1 endonuclease/exonuclease/phosphatase family protein [Rhizobium laguerreae]